MNNLDFYSHSEYIQRLIQAFCYQHREPIPILPEEVDKILVRLINIGMLNREEIEKFS
jgi:hypothetical protein